MVYRSTLMNKLFLILIILGLLSSCQSQAVEMEAQPDFTQYIYMEQVVEYTTEQQNKSVILENRDYQIILRPEMIFEIKLKKEKRTITGRWGYRMNLSTEEGAMYFMIMDDPNSISREKFLNESNYTINSDIILVPTGATEKHVRYAIKESSINFNQNNLVFKKTIR